MATTAMRSPIITHLGVAVAPSWYMRVGSSSASPTTIAALQAGHRALLPAAPSGACNLAPHLQSVWAMAVDHDTSAGRLPGLGRAAAQTYTAYAAGDGEVAQPRCPSPHRTRSEGTNSAWARRTAIEPFGRWNSSWLVISGPLRGDDRSGLIARLHAPYLGEVRPRGAARQPSAFFCVARVCVRRDTGRLYLVRSGQMVADLDLSLRLVFSKFYREVLATE